jgi:plasmid stabilization system protein ParE
MAGEIELSWSPEALEQLEFIFKYVAERDPEAAARLIQRLDELAEGIVFTPEIGRMVPEYGRPDLRERIHGQRHKRYRLIYRVRPGEIEIVAVWHTSREKLPEL